MKELIRSKMPAARFIIGFVFILSFFSLFIAPNSTGIRDKNMLAAFDVDEYAQYEVLTRMITPADTVTGTVKGFLVYNYYYYGYPFFLSSALVAIPIKLITRLFGSDTETRYIVLGIRQLGVALMLLSIVLLANITVRKRHDVLFIILLLIMGLVPAITEINMWWHPDHLATLSVVTTIYALNRDRFNFGKWYYISAFSCGFATGTRIYGLFFFLTIAYYLFTAFQSGRFGFKNIINKGLSFILLMAAGIFASNPLLLIPGVSRQVMEIFFSVLSWHGDVKASHSSVLERLHLWYTQSIRDHFGFWWLYATTLFLLVWVALKDRMLRSRSMIFLTWILPISFYVFLRVTHTTHNRYWLPILIPLLSTWGFILPAMWKRVPRNFRTPAFIAIICMFGVQIYAHIPNIAKAYQRVLSREETSGALKFHDQIVQEIITKLRETKPGALNIFRDPWVYVAPEKDLIIHMKWGAANYSDIVRVNPDLILLQEYYIRTNAIPESGPRGLTFEELSAGKFYSDAQKKQIKGHIFVGESTFGVAYISERFKKYLPMHLK